MTRKTVCLFVWTILALWMASGATADVKLPALFSDHMVLQADKSAAVWGWASPGELGVGR